MELSSVPGDQGGALAGWLSPAGVGGGGGEGLARVRKDAEHLASALSSMLRFRRNVTRMNCARKLRSECLLGTFERHLTFYGPS